MTTETTKTPKTRIVRKARITKAEKEQAQIREAVLGQPRIEAMSRALREPLEQFSMTCSVVDGDDPFFLAQYAGMNGEITFKYNGTWNVKVTNTTRPGTILTMLAFPHESPHDLDALLEMVTFRLPQVLALLGQKVAAKPSDPGAPDMREIASPGPGTSQA